MIGGFLFALLGVAFAMTVWRDASPTVASSPAPVVETSALQSLEDRLGRSIVMYVDGAVPADFSTALQALDAKVGALANPAEIRTLMDLDVYVMLRDSWDVYRALENHDLSALIRAQAQNKSAEAGVAWFEAALGGQDDAKRDVLVILAAQTGLAEVSAFCFALTIYDVARYAGNGAAFLEATEGDGSQWRYCRAKGWTSVADMGSNDG